jgi:transcriptional regulator GlxA family with amidase domain
VKSLRLGIVAGNGFTLAALALLTDHLCLAVDTTKFSAPSPSWSIMSNTREIITASCGMAIQPDSGLLPAGALDYVVVIGGALDEHPNVDRDTLDYLRTVGDSNVPLVGICTGSFVLAAAGVMDGHTSCVSWFHYRAFRSRFPRQRAVADRLFLADGRRITSVGGIGTAALATHLIAKHLSSTAAKRASQMLMFDRAPAGIDAQPQPPALDWLQEPRLRRCMILMEQNIEVPLSIVEIAGQLDISARQLERLCLTHAQMSPSRLYDEVRFHYARWMVKNTRRPLVEIAISTGFKAGAYFSRRFKERFGETPSDFRGVNGSTAMISR